MSHVSDGALHAYLDGESSEAQREEIERHLADCAACRERLEEATALGEGASELLAELEPVGVRAPSWREIEERAEARRAAPPRRSWARIGLAWAASIAIAFGVGWFSQLQMESPRGGALTGRRMEAPAAAVEPSREMAARIRGQVSSVESDRPMAEAKAEMPEAVPTTTPAAGAGEVAGATRASEQVRQAETEQMLAADEDLPVSRDTTQLARKTVERSDDAAVGREAPAAAPEEVDRVAELREATDAAAFDRARRDFRAQNIAAAEGLADTPNLAATGSGFVSISEEAAPRWLGVQLLMLPDLERVRVEAGPAAVLESGLAGRVAIRQVYRTDSGDELVLTQQWTGDLKPEETEPTLVVEPSGLKSYHWTRPGYRLALEGPVSADSLRALAERVR